MTQEAPVMIDTSPATSPVGKEKGRIFRRHSVSSNPAERQQQMDKIHQATRENPTHRHKAENATTFDERLASHAQNLSELLTNQKVDASPETIAQHISSHVGDAQRLLQPTTPEKIMNVIGPIARPITKLASAVIHIDDLATHIASEGLNYQAATGKNPNVGIGRAIAVGGIELGISAVTTFLDIEGGIGLAIDAGVDYLVGKYLEKKLYPKTEVMGEKIEHKSSNGVVTAAGLVPWVPVAPTLMLSQWYGRYLLRHELKGNPDQMSPAAQETVLNVASWSTLKDYQQNHRRK
ncbi:MAG TPA: hypothetical protein VF189_05310 [Patescibacteria group bacterium]